MHDQFTLLHEDGDKRILHEFKAVHGDDVMRHIIDFMKGLGYLEETIFTCMKDLSDSYFESIKPMTLPLLQDDLVLSDEID